MRKVVKAGGLPEVLRFAILGWIVPFVYSNTPKLRLASGQGGNVLVRRMSMRIPFLILTKLYVKGSLHNKDQGFQFTIKNVLAPGTVVKFLALDVDGKEYPPGDVLLLVNGTQEIEAVEVSSQAPLFLGLGREVTVKVRRERLSLGLHEMVLSFLTREVGVLKVPVRASIEG